MQLVTTRITIKAQLPGFYCYNNRALIIVSTLRLIGGVTSHCHANCHINDNCTERTGTTILGLSRSEFVYNGTFCRVSQSRVTRVEPAELEAFVQSIERVTRVKLLSVKVSRLLIIIRHIVCFYSEQ